MRLFWAILASWCVVIGVVWSEEYETGSCRYAVERIEDELAIVGDLVQAYGEREGRYPTTDEGLGVFVVEEDEIRARWKPGIEAGTKGEWHERVKGGSLFERFTHMAAGYNIRPMPGGIEGWPGVPLVYENRRGQDKALYAKSPANEYAGTPCCLELDKDIYLYSLPGIRFWRYVREGDIGLAVVWVVMGTVTTGCIFMLVRTWWKRRRERKVVPRSRSIHILNGLLGAALVLFGMAKLGIVVIACYPGTVLAMWRHHQAAEQYTELLDEFHSRGVIRDETWEKLKKASSEEASYQRYEDHRDGRFLDP